jgi:tetrahydromethanopterin S-methyltransferase subunit H
MCGAETKWTLYCHAHYLVKEANYGLFDLTHDLVATSEHTQKWVDKTFDPHLAKDYESFFLHGKERILALLNFVNNLTLQPDGSYKIREDG